MSKLAAAGFGTATLVGIGTVAVGAITGAGAVTTADVFGASVCVASGMIATLASATATGVALAEDR